MQVLRWAIAHINTYTNTYTLYHTHTHTHTHISKDTHTHAYTHSPTHTHTFIHTQIYTYTDAHNTHSLSLFLVHTHTHTYWGHNMRHSQEVRRWALLAETSAMPRCCPLPVVGRKECVSVLWVTINARQTDFDSCRSQNMPYRHTVQLCGTLSSRQTCPGNPTPHDTHISSDYLS